MLTLTFDSGIKFALESTIEELIADSVFLALFSFTS